MVQRIFALQCALFGMECLKRYLSQNGLHCSSLSLYMLCALQAAYAAMQATPVPERQLESLHRLLGELCARGDIATLVQLPLSGKPVPLSYPVDPSCLI